VRTRSYRVSRARSAPPGQTTVPVSGSTIGDEGAPPRERVTNAGALEGVQVPAQREPVEVGVLGVGERDRLGGPVVIVLQLVHQFAGAVLELDIWVLAEELGERGRQRRVPGHGPSPAPSRLK
jgi:hypothetical protein